MGGYRALSSHEVVESRDCPNMKSLICFMVILGLVTLISVHGASLEQEYEDRINDLTDAEVIDSYLRTLPKVILWKLRYARKTELNKLLDAAMSTDEVYDERVRRGNYKALRRYG